MSPSPPASAPPDQESPPPERPDCCGGGCAVCVLEAYAEEYRRWQEQVKAQRRAASGARP